VISLNETQLVLASGSPRRKELLTSLRIPFKIQPSEKEEIYPEDLLCHDVPQFLAELKAVDVFDKLDGNIAVIGADTVVVLNNQILGKPKDKKEAFNMLSNLSDTAHDVYTGVCIITPKIKRSFTVQTKVHFKHLSNDEIERYIDECQPFDKAGAYGIQDWIGQTKIQKLEGDYFNVMGFPISRIGIELKEILK
jgi:septum formation protein